MLNRSQYPRLLVAGTQSGVGKTTVALALMAAFVTRGHCVQAFKVGPDFIDPGHHRLVTGRNSHNLDGWMLSPEQNRRTVIEAAADADLSIIEGMMGLFDGSSPVEERGSTGEMAKYLQAPVLLVIDGSAMARSVAAMAQGYQHFDQDLPVVAVLFNRLSGEGHYQLLKEALEQSTTLKAVGYLKKDAELLVEDRHLGLQTAIEQEHNPLYQQLGLAAMETIDLDRIEALAKTAPVLSCPEGKQKEVRQKKTVRSSRVRIGMAFDSAFCFYYPTNLSMLESAGATLIPFSPLEQGQLPECDGLYFGGGYPELYAQRLSHNTSMRQQVLDFARQGGVIFAECGGLMYLSRSLRDLEKCEYSMVGVFSGDIVMDRGSLTLGYRTVTIQRPSWLGQSGQTVRGHEFHYSSFRQRQGLRGSCQLKDSRGGEKGDDGFLVQNCLALYTHLHFASQPTIAQSLVTAAQTFSPIASHYGAPAGESDD